VTPEDVEKMETTMFLCDFAEALNGKLYIMGGGWTICAPGPRNLALAIKVLVPWDKTNEKHKLKLILQDKDGHTIDIGSPPRPVISDGEFEVGRPPNTPKGAPLDFAIAINFMALPLEPDTQYRWQLEIDDKTTVGVSFRTIGNMPPPPGS
jgi:hypothetical protein